MSGCAERACRGPGDPSHERRDPPAFGHRAPRPAGLRGVAAPGLRRAAQARRGGPACAGLVKLRYFAGLTQEEAARALGVTRRTASRYWAFARAWLRRALGEPGGPPGP